MIVALDLLGPSASNALVESALLQMATGSLNMS